MSDVIDYVFSEMGKWASEHADSHHDREWIWREVSDALGGIYIGLAEKIVRAAMGAAQEASWLADDYGHADKEHFAFVLGLRMGERAGRFLSEQEAVR